MWNSTASPGCRVDPGAVLGLDHLAGPEPRDVDQPALGDDLRHGLDPQLPDAGRVGELLDA